MCCCNAIKCGKVQGGGHLCKALHFLFDEIYKSPSKHVTIQEKTNICAWKNALYDFVFFIYFESNIFPTLVSILSNHLHSQLLFINVRTPTIKYNESPFRNSTVLPMPL